MDKKNTFYVGGSKTRWGNSFLVEDMVDGIVCRPSVVICTCETRSFLINKGTKKQKIIYPIISSGKTL